MQFRRNLYFLFIFGFSGFSVLLTGCLSAETSFKGGIDASIFKDHPSRCKLDETTQAFPPEGINANQDIEKKFDSSAGFSTATASGCIHGNLLTVWARTHSDQFLEWTGVDSASTQESLKNPDGSHSHFYRVYTESSPVSWSTVFYHTILNGTLNDPQQIKIDFQITDISWDKAIPHWSGIIILQKVDENVTSIIIRTEFKAMQSDDKNTDDAALQLIELYGDAQSSIPNWDRLGATISGK